MNRLFATLEVANFKGISDNLWGIKNSPDKNGRTGTDENLDTRPKFFKRAPGRRRQKKRKKGGKSDYIHDRSVLLEKGNLPADQRVNLNRTMMDEEDAWLDWKVAREMLDNWLGISEEIAA